MSSAKGNRKDATYAFAENIVATQFEDIPPKVVKVTKDDILDTIGVALSGSSTAGISALMELIREWGGKGESTVLVFGDKVPAVNAALVNATMAHSDDFDDAYDLNLTHTGATTVLPALAIAERLGKVSGKDLITALALGQDMALRMSSYLGINHGLHYSVVYGYFGGTAVVAKLLGLSEEQTVSAFGIAYSQLSGTLQAVEDGSLTKRLQAGFSARGTVLSALLAQKNYEGSKDNIEGRCGFINVYGEGQSDIEALTADLGKTFYSIYLGFKPYPTGR